MLSLVPPFDPSDTVGSEVLGGRQTEQLPITTRFNRVVAGMLVDNRGHGVKIDTSDLGLGCEAARVCVYDTGVPETSSFTGKITLFREPYVTPSDIAASLEGYFQLVYAPSGQYSNIVLGLDLGNSIKPLRTPSAEQLLVLSFFAKRYVEGVEATVAPENSSQNSEVTPFRAFIGAARRLFKQRL